MPLPLSFGPCVAFCSAVIPCFLIKHPHYTIFTFLFLKFLSLNNVRVTALLATPLQIHICILASCILKDSDNGRVKEESSQGALRIITQALTVHTVCSIYFSHTLHTSRLDLCHPKSSFVAPAWDSENRTSNTFSVV